MRLMDNGPGEPSLFSLLWPHTTKTAANQRMLNFLSITYPRFKNIPEARLVSNCQIEDRLFPGCGYKRISCVHDALENCTLDEEKEKTIDLKATGNFENHRGTKVCMHVCIPLLQECTNLKSYRQGKHIHAHIIKRGDMIDIFITNTLMNMYIKCGSSVDAQNIFDRMPRQNLFTWNIIIAGYGRDGNIFKVLKLYAEMLHQDLEPNRITFIILLGACASTPSLQHGKVVHAIILKVGCTLDTSVCSTLMNMYGKCGSMADAFQIFENTPERNVVCWNIIISSAVHRDSAIALKLFWKMKAAGMKASKVTLLVILKACASKCVIEEGKCLHAYILNNALKLDIQLAHALIDMYVKCRNLEIARDVFDRLCTQDVFVWTTIIEGYTEHGDGKEAVMLFAQMQLQSVEPDVITMMAILRSCASIPSFEQGKRIHSFVMSKEDSMTLGNPVNNTTIDMYTKCGSMEMAYHMFSRMSIPDTISWNAIIAGCMRNGHTEEALRLLAQMEQEELVRDDVTFINSLNACTSVAAFARGKRTHGSILKVGLDSNTFVLTALIDMYANCGSLENAQAIFGMTTTKDDLTWATMASAFIQHDDNRSILYLFQRMKQEVVKPSRAVFLDFLHAFSVMSSLEHGKMLHAEVLAVSPICDSFLGSALIDMYIKCRSLGDADRVFDSSLSQDVILWNSMLRGYCWYGLSKKALNMFKEMHEINVKPDSTTFVSIFNICADLADMGQAKYMHTIVLKLEWEPDVFVSSALIDMYFRCDSMDNACKLFNSLLIRNVILWNVMISGFSHHGNCRLAIKLFGHMQEVALCPDKITFISILNGCSSVQNLEFGKKVHSEILISSYSKEILIYNSLVDMYAKCGSINDAFQVFSIMPTWDVVSWNTMIGGYMQYGTQGVFDLFWEMEQASTKPDQTTYVSMLTACSGIAWPEYGKRIHAAVLNSGYISDVSVASMLIEMYVQVKWIMEAHLLFTTVPTVNGYTWTIMIGEFAQSQHNKTALKLFMQMQVEDLNPSKTDFINGLTACANMPSFEAGKQVHSNMLKRGCEFDLFVGSSLINMYAKCCSLEDSCKVFKHLDDRNVVVWNALIGGYFQHGDAKKALDLYRKMQIEGVKPDAVTFVFILSVCGFLSNLEDGRKIHHHMLETGCELDVFLESALVDMYAKCGSIHEAYSIFGGMRIRSIVSWNAMIGGHARHGNSIEVLTLFEQMQQERVEPDLVTFISILSACSHACLVDEGHRYFHLMSYEYNIIPNEDHYTCMIDLLGHAGHLKEALELLNRIPFQPNVILWMSFLGACRNHMDVGLAELATEHVLKLEPENAAALSLLSTYAQLQKSTEVN